LKALALGGRGSLFEELIDHIENKEVELWRVISIPFYTSKCKWHLRRYLI
jgi:hypothetical protein